MSGQWEVVGKKKDKGNKALQQKISKEEKKKANTFNVNIEEVLAKSQVKSLYGSNKDKPKETQKVVQEVSNTKKQQKKPAKTQENNSNKVKPPKSIESALNLISPEEFKNIFEKSKQQFPNAPIVWLQELSQFLNNKITVEIQDPLFASKPDNYPFSVVPQPLKQVIEKSVKNAEEYHRIVESFYQISLTGMVTDMGKNLPAIGHKIFLQYLTLYKPSIVLTSLNKYKELRNSYQNRPNICLSLFWAVGQAGFKDFQVGLKVFEELFLPLVELKNYSRFIVKYLIKLLKSADKNTELTKENYLLILDTLFGNKKNFPTDCKDESVKLGPKLKPYLFASKKPTKEQSHNTYVDTFIKTLSINSNKVYQDLICDVIVECFIKDCTSFEVWCKVYNKNLLSSAIILKHINHHWSKYSKKLNHKAFRDYLDKFVVTNSELSVKKRKEEGLDTAITAIKEIQEKMTKQPTIKSNSFPFKKLLFLFVLIISGIVCYDVKENGSWEDSRTRQALKQSGICEFTHLAFNQTRDGVEWIKVNIKQNFPGFYRTTSDFTEPYIQLGRDFGIIVYNMFGNLKEIVVEKYPIVLHSIESYAPGLIEQSQNAVSSVWSTSVLYFNRSVDYLRKEVFVGQLSPENMQRVVIEAFNTTQQKATEYYHWLYEKVQTSIK